MNRYYQIRWKNADAQGSVDTIDGALLDIRHNRKQLLHPTVVGKDSRISTFDIEVDGDALLFRYGGNNSAANEAQGIYRGDVRIVPAQFASASTLSWRDSEDQPWQELPVEITRHGSSESGRNPDWNRDELILALDLYFTNPANPPGKDSAAVADLSALLNKMHRLTGGATSETFRNANGVYLKMMNLRALDPAYTAQGKVGMKAGGALEKVVWAEYQGKQELLAADAGIIRDAVMSADEVAVSALHSNAPYEGEEGGVVVRLHRRYERNARLIAEKKKAAKAAGNLACEVCEFDFAKSYGELGEDFIEVHHTKPVHQMKSGAKTTLADLALLCSNCHRMAHRRRLPLSLAALRAAMKAD